MAIYRKGSDRQPDPVGGETRVALARSAADPLTASIVRDRLRGRTLAYCAQCLATGLRSADVKPIKTAVLTFRRPGFLRARCLCGAVGVKYAGAANYGRRSSRR
jgi:hypothetical protein